MNLLHLSLSLLKTSVPGEESLQQTLEEEKRDRKRFVYVCKFCKTKITAPIFEIAVQEKHIHLCANPHGILFEVACFSKAWNYLPVGTPTLEFTWFPGYRWQIILCSSCLAHLGWEYSSPVQTFVGLIRPRLLKEEKGD